MSAPSAEIHAMVRELLHDRDQEISFATRFDDLTAWDSMDLVTVMVEVEGRFGVRLDHAEVDRIITVGDLARIIEAKA